MEERVRAGRAAIYVREDQPEGKQERVCREYGALRLGCAPEGMPLYADGAGSRRPEYDRLLAHLRAGRLDTVLCAELGRICRGAEEFTQLTELCAEYGASLIAIKEQLDTGTPLGGMALYAASLLGGLESVSAAERLRENMQALARTGRWLGGVAPTGYHAIAERGREKGRKACQLAVLP